MCIKNDRKKVAEQRQRMTVLQLWKVVCGNNSIGLWHETSRINNDYQVKFHIGEQAAHNYHPQKDFGSGYEEFLVPGAFHCCFTRETARSYLKYRTNCGVYGKLKIIKVYADSCDVVSVGVDTHHTIFAISVSKMTIKSLKHQR